MAEVNPPWALQNLATHTANVSRDFMTLLNGGAEGILPNSLLGTMGVSQRGAGANMSVDIAAGFCSVFGDETNVQGLYCCVNDAVVNKSIAAADPTNPRRDLVVARVRDAFYSGSTNAWDLFVVTGTPAASPADPAVPNNCLTLARVAVATSASSITNANITDLRCYSPLGIIPTNSARPPGTLYGPYSQEPAFKIVPVAGSPIFEQDTYSLKQYTTATTGFRPPWNMPWGVVGSAVGTAVTGVTTTETNVGSLVVTFNQVQNRRYRITVRANLRVEVTAGGNGLLYIRAGDTSGSTQIDAHRLYNPTASWAYSGTFVTQEVAASSTSVTRAARIINNGGTTQWNNDVSANQLSFMLVEDIGPSANPV